MRFLPAALALATLAPAAAAEAPAPPDPAAIGRHARGSWYIGFGLGAGAGSLRLGDRTYALGDLVGRSAPPLAVNFRAGITATRHLLVGLDSGALAARASSPSEAFQLNYYDLGAMYFPWEHGLYLRGALGRSVLVAESDGPVVVGKATRVGWNGVAGVGYAAWLGRSFNLTFNVDYQSHFLGGSGAVAVKGGSGWSAWLGFDWY